MSREHDLETIAYILKKGNCQGILCDACKCPLNNDKYCENISIRRDFLLVQNEVQLAQIWLVDNKVTKADLLPYLF